MILALAEKAHDDTGIILVCVVFVCAFLIGRWFGRR
jgi:hypothetical protein